MTTCDTCGAEIYESADGSMRCSGSGLTWGECFTLQRLLHLLGDTRSEIVKATAKAR